MKGKPRASFSWGTAGLGSWAELTGAGMGWNQLCAVLWGPDHRGQG